MCVCVWQGALKSVPLQEELRKYERGKCAQSITISAGTDLSKYSVAILKKLVKDKRLDCMGCTEKADYVARLRQWQSDQGEL